MAQPAKLDDILKAIQDQTAEILRLSPPPAMAAMMTFKASSATSIMLLLANPGRRGLILVNTDANDLYLRYGPTASTASGGWTYKIPAGATWEMAQPIYGGRIDGIWTLAGAGIAEMTEM